MIKKIFALSLMIGFSVFLAGCNLQTTQEKTTVTENMPSEVPTVTATPFEPYTATFAIYTHTTKRIFTQAMYHNLSADAFITAEQPETITVETPGTTWQTFFDSLPFSLTQDCLITGTKQQFCNQGENQLHFILNKESVPTVLGQSIQPDDNLVVIFGSQTTVDKILNDL